MTDGRLHRTLWGASLRWLTAMSLVIVVALAVTAHTLYVVHLAWSTRVDLTGLLAVEIDPQAMRDARMTFGSGSFASFFRTFHNERLGHFRAFATDRERAVVLRFPEHTVVITPADPEALAADLHQCRG